MIILLNLVIIGLVALIAYWWANEGLFSSFLHLVCVIAAGILALAFWEPITMSIMRGGGFDNYAWGVVLVGMFTISLLALRYITDKIVPFNILFPPWANMAFGGLAGAGAGVLTIGLCMIGSGFLQSSNEFMGYRGVSRNENNRGMIEFVGDPLWLDVPKLTANFFSLLSVGTFHPDISGTPLRHYNPNIDVLSTLVRDSFDNGKGQLSLLPNAAKVTKIATSEDGLFLIQVTFTSKANDFGAQLILSSSQVRLIGEASGQENPNIYYPTAWKQELKEGGERLFWFDDVSHYATSIPGRQENGIKFVFDTKDMEFKPRFLQIRGTRLALPSEEPTLIPLIARKEYRGHQLTEEEFLELWDPLGKDIQHLITSTSKIRGLRISTNGIPGTIEYDEDYYFTEGTLTTVWTQRGVSMGLAIKGIRANPGTVIMQVDVSPNGNAAFEELVPFISSDSPVNLIDSNGRRYSPIGYFIKDAKRMRLTLTPSTPIRTIGELPMHVLTSSSSKGMVLIFQVTEGEWIQELRVGERTIGTCNIKAKARRR